MTTAVMAIATTAAVAPTSILTPASSVLILSTMSHRGFPANPAEPGDEEYESSIPPDESEDANSKHSSTVLNDNAEEPQSDDNPAPPEQSPSLNSADGRIAYELATHVIGAISIDEPLAGRSRKPAAFIAVRPAQYPHATSLE